MTTVFRVITFVGSENGYQVTHRQWSQQNALIWYVNPDQTNLYYNRDYEVTEITEQNEKNALFLSFKLTVSGVGIITTPYLWKEKLQHQRVTQFYRTLIRKL